MRVRFEPTISVVKRAKTFRALDHSTTMTGSMLYLLQIIIGDNWTHTETGSSRLHFWGRKEERPMVLSVLQCHDAHFPLAASASCSTALGVLAWLQTVQCQTACVQESKSFLYLTIRLPLTYSYTLLLFLARIKVKTTIFRIAPFFFFQKATLALRWWPQDLTPPIRPINSSAAVEWLPKECCLAGSACVSANCDVTLSLTELRFRNHAWVLTWALFTCTYRRYHVFHVFPKLPKDSIPRYAITFRLARSCLISDT
jgi:hypothetical protein